MHLKNITRHDVKVNKNPNVIVVFKQYPKMAQKRLRILRQLIIDSASQISKIKAMQETLKWNEPAYIVEGGSTIRLGWKKSAPNQYAIYFNCKTKLVDTFKEIYKDIFKYEGNRAIVFEMNDEVCVEELKHCIELALTYHARKNLPLLGV